MKNTGRRNILDAVLDEYVVWGGPIITRREALADCRANGFDDKAIDTLVFGRREVPAPADPAANLAFLRQIQAL
jgi:hypothetical protein